MSYGDALKHQSGRTGVFDAYLEYDGKISYRQRGTDKYMQHSTSLDWWLVSINDIFINRYLVLTKSNLMMTLVL